jgi:hypothetical protein
MATTRICIATMQVAQISEPGGDFEIVSCTSKCRYLPPRLLYIANCGRGLVPKDAESMGREKPLLDFSNK